MEDRGRENYFFYSSFFLFYMKFVFVGFWGRGMFVYFESMFGSRNYDVFGGLLIGRG